MDNAVSDLEVKSCVDTSLSNNAENKSNTNVEDPYAYIEKNGFTSEKFKIEIRGLPKYYGMGVSKKVLFIICSF